MRFMIIGMATEQSEPGPPPTPEQFAAMQNYNARAAESGMLLAAEGLAPTARGARVTFRGEERLVTDGPFTEAKEVIAGFSIIRAGSLAEAIEWVKRAPNVARNGEALVEIRKVMDVEDFGENFTPNEEIAKVKIQ
ncbi:MAG: YciI family protein [Gemmatimonadales bacterium]